MAFLPPKRKFLSPPISIISKKTKTTPTNQFIRLAEPSQSLQAEEKIESLNTPNRKFFRFRRFKKIGLDVEERYELREELGRGKYGTVRICHDRKTDKMYACKSILKRGDGHGDSHVKKEIEVMRLLRQNQYEGVVRLKEVFESPDRYHLILELCNGGSLWDQMVREGKPYSEEKAADVMKSLMRTISDLHRIGVVHRDIKPENILITADGRLKLGDFGIAEQLFEGEYFCQFAGSPFYVAPEVIERSYTEKADVWSAGVLMFVLLQWRAPFRGRSRQDICDVIQFNEIDFDGPDFAHVSRSGRDLLRKMLTKNPNLRPSAQEVLDHPWMKLYAPDDSSESIDALVREIEKLNVPASEFHGPYLPVQKHYLFERRTGFLCAAY